MIPWSISFYFIFVSRSSTSTPKSANVLLHRLSSSISARRTYGQIDLVSSKMILASYTVLVTPSLISSYVYLYRNPKDNPWAENEAAEDPLDGYLSKLPITFDLFVPLILIYYHKVFRKKCRELYLHGFRNSVSDDRQISISHSKNNEHLSDDAPVLFLESSGVINVRYPSEDGFLIKECDTSHEQPNDSNGKKVVRFSRRVSKVPNENSEYSTKNEPKDEESRL